MVGVGLGGWAQAEGVPCLPLLPGLWLGSRHAQRCICLVSHIKGECWGLAEGEICMHMG